MDFDLKTRENNKKIKEYIDICHLKEKYGPTKTAEIVTNKGRKMGETTVCQIYSTYQVLLASKTIQKLFYLGRITWAKIYKTRGIYNRGSINRDSLKKLESELLRYAGLSEQELKSLLVDPESYNYDIDLNYSSYDSLDDYYDFLEKEICRSKNNKKSRLKRLKKAPIIPDSLRILHKVFKRNPDVIAEVLERAKGICERCQKPAPFMRKSDNTPFLEVHHSIPLAQGGEDTVKNAIALCPNCHREMHYGLLEE